MRGTRRRSKGSLLLILVCRGECSLRASLRLLGEVSLGMSRRLPDAVMMVSAGVAGVRADWLCFVVREISTIAAPFLVFLAEHGHGGQSRVIVF